MIDGPAALAMGAEDAKGPASSALDSVAALRAAFPDAVVRSHVVCGQSVVYVTNARAHAVLEWLQDDPAQQFNYLTDITCVEYRDPERELEVVYQLRSLDRKVDLRVKIPLSIPDGLRPRVQSVFDLVERRRLARAREAWDMFEACVPRPS